MTHKKPGRPLVITRRTNVLLLLSLLLTACGGPSAGDTVVDFVRALDFGDQEHAQELLHSEVDIIYQPFATFDRSQRVNLLKRAARIISDRDGISSIEVISERTVNLGLADIELADAIGGQVQRVETRITFGDGTELERAWHLVMAFERYQIVEIPDLLSD